MRVRGGVAEQGRGGGRARAHVAAATALRGQAAGNALMRIGGGVAQQRRRRRRRWAGVAHAAALVGNPAQLAGVTIAVAEERHVGGRARALVARTAGGIELAAAGSVGGCARAVRQGGIGTWCCVDEGGGGVDVRSIARRPRGPAGRVKVTGPDAEQGAQPARANEGFAGLHSTPPERAQDPHDRSGNQGHATSV